MIKSWFLAHPLVCVRLFCMSMPDQLYLQQQQVYFCAFSAVFLHFTVHFFNVPNALISSKRWREFCTPYSMFLEVHQYWKLKLHVFHTNMFICTVCTGINFLHFVVDVGLCMKIKGFQSLMKIVYTLNSTIICNIMILHSWVNGWSCITWYNVYVARVYRISNICSTVHW